MKFLSPFCYFYSIIFGLLLCHSLTAQPNPPFKCSEEVYFSNSANNTTTLAFNNPSNVVFTYPFTFNAIGYNPKDNYIYVVKRTGDEIVRLHADGTYRNLGNVGNWGITGPVVGTFDENGLYYVREGNGTNSTVAVVNVQNMTFTNMDSGSFDAKDWAYHHETNSFYGAHAGELHIFTPPNTFTKKALIGMDPSDGPVFGSAFYSKDKKLYVLNNVSTNLYQIDVEAGVAKFIIKYNSNAGDATTCPEAYPPYPIVYARPDTFCLPGTGNIVYNVIQNDTAVFSTINLASLQINLPPKHGTTQINSITGEITYISASNQIDSFYYKISSTSNALVSDIGKVYIKPAVNVTFDPLGPFCENENPSILPNSSKELISGVWSPNVINTSIQGITNYTFTAANSSLCVLPFNLPVEILPTVIPEFDFKRDYCQNESPEILSSISKNNIDGVWSPSTINTMIPGKYTFTFTPSQIHKCTKSINEAIDVQPEIYPQFIIPDSICFNSQELLLPSLSQNNVAGIWSPLKVTTTTAGNYLFNFTSDKTANKCNRDVSKNITVLKPISLKTLPPFCDPSLIYYEQTFEVSGSSEKFGQITSTFGVVEWIGPNTFKIKQIPSESNLSIQIKDNFGCVITESIPKHKCNCPNTLPFANKDTSYCKGTEIPEIAPDFSQTNHKFVWKNAMGNTVGNSKSYKPVLPGIYTLEIVNNINNCVTHTQVFNVKENPLPLKPTVNNDTICFGLKNGTLIPTNWISGNNTIWYDQNNNVIGNNTQINNLAPGNYKVKFTDQVTGCVSDTENVKIIERSRIDLINETKLCADSLKNYGLTFTAKGDGSVYNFSTSQNFNILNIGSKKYQITGINGLNEIIVTAKDEFGCSVKDTLKPDVNPIPSIDLGSDQVLDCITKKATLNASSNLSSASSYSWFLLPNNNNIGNSKSLEVSQKGIYVAEIRNTETLCKNRDTIEIFLSDIKADILENDETCAGDNNGSIEIKNLTGYHGKYNIYFNNVQTQKTTFTDLIPGSYPIIIQDDAGCQYKNMAIVKKGQELSIKTESPLRITEGNNVQINATINIPQNEIQDIIWTPTTSLSCTDCLNPLAKPTDSTTYEIVVISKEGCISRSQVTVFVEKILEIIFPNVFNPNSPNGNRFFSIFPYPFVKSVKKMSVFDRWGNLVYQAENFTLDQTDKFWDGTFNGAFVENGVYIYIAEIEFTSGRVQAFKGDLTVIK